MIDRRLTLAILGTVVGIAALIYLFAGLNASGTTTLIMPLDDTYIHFQYARAIAEGHPFRYNPDQPPTSGATSLIYPVILAVGYKLGFTDERLAWWALAIGVICWLASTWLVYRIAARDGTPESNRIALVVAIAFALSGSLGWAFMSGMETGLMIFATLLTLWYAVKQDRRGVVAAGTLAALVRPEGVAIGLLAVVYFVMVRSPSSAQNPAHRRFTIWYLVPIFAGLLQPIINFAVTGSATASGMQAKSFLYNVPQRGILDNMLDVVLRTWTELITGVSAVDGLYFVFILSWLAILALALGLRHVWQTRRPTIELLILGWLLALTAAVSILETAFWQFKRYQQPMIALLFPLAAWALIWLWQRRPARMARIAVMILLVILLGGSIITTAEFVGNYADNVREVASSQIPMARYVAQNIPPGAIVGVHDIGVMRYLGQHDTYDVIGLTTPGAALAWRNGPGAVFEQMLTSPWRPDYFAIYKDARGLSFLAETDLFDEILAHFPSTQPPHNVASATNSGQSVYRADWTFAAFAKQPWQPSSLQAMAGMKLVDSVNVADLASENAHHYRWWEAVQRSGFATEVREWTTLACQPSADNPMCRVLDGGRLITGGEEMTIATTPGQDLIWITRVHPGNSSTIRVMPVVNGKQQPTRVIPSIPGQWLEIATLIPGSEITGALTQIRMEANIADPAVGHYMPYYHWFYQGTYKPRLNIPLPAANATFGQAIVLRGRALTYNSTTRTVQVDLAWELNNPSGLVQPGDAKVFIHLYDQTDKPPVAQIDETPGQGSLPPANWLPGIVTDQYTIIVPANMPAGSYKVAIGMYDPANPTQRLPVSGEGADQAGRLFIGTVEIR